MTEGSGTIMFLPAVVAVLDDYAEGWMLLKECFEATSTEVAQVFATACCELTDFVRHRWCGLARHVRNVAAGDSYPVALEKNNTTVW
jgi:hypothetical protein